MDALSAFLISIIVLVVVFYLIGMQLHQLKNELKLQSEQLLTLERRISEFSSFAKNTAETRRSSTSRSRTRHVPRRHRESFVAESPNVDPEIERRLVLHVDSLFASQMKKLKDSVETRQLQLQHQTEDLKLRLQEHQGQISSLSAEKLQQAIVASAPKSTSAVKTLFDDVTESMSSEEDDFPAVVTPIAEVKKDAPKLSSSKGTPTIAGGWDFKGSVRDDGTGLRPLSTFKSSFSDSLK